MKRFAWGDTGQTNWLPAVVGGSIGAVLFLLIYGYEVIVPTHVDWLLAGGDLSQHYIGWEFFRQSAWTFPIGVAKDLAYPHGLAITFMDSLPLLAIPAKLFAGVLPDQFQYFGLWGFGSFIAMGSLAALTAKRLIKDWWGIVSVTIIMCLSPLMLQRLFTHTALGGQWIVLAAVYAVLCARDWSRRRSVIVWSVIVVLSVLIHPYFLAMNMFLLMIAVIIRYRTLRRSTSELLLPIVAGLLTTWIIGGFSFTTISGDKFGDAGYDLAAPVLANGWSLASLPATTRFEMNLYFGWGVLFLLCVAVVFVVRGRSKLQAAVAGNRWQTIALAVVTALLLIAAIGPTVRVAGLQLLHYDVPAVIEKIWGIFRVTARLAWPLWYGAVVLALLAVVRFSKGRGFARAVIVAACVLQAIDIGASPQLWRRHEQLAQSGSVVFHAGLTDSAWGDVVKGKRHIVYLGDLYESQFVAIAQLAVDHRMTLNTGYFARKPTLAIERTITEARAALAAGVPAQDTLYIYNQPFTVAAGVSQRVIEGYNVATR